MPLLQKTMTRQIVLEGKGTKRRLITLAITRRRGLQAAPAKGNDMEEPNIEEVLLRMARYNSDYDENWQPIARPVAEAPSGLERWGKRALAAVVAGAVAVTLAVGAERQASRDKILNSQNAQIVSHIQATQAENAAQLENGALAHTGQ